MIWLSDKYVYWGFHESIGFADIQLAGLPKTITIEDNRLPIKSEFHISLIDLETTAEFVNPKNAKEVRAKIIEDAKEFLKSDKLDEFELLHKFQFVQKDIRKSVIVRCELPGAEKFFTMLREKYKKPIPLQPFHITLYALPKDKGIGLWSDRDIKKYSIPIEMPELKNIRAV